MLNNANDLPPHSSPSLSLSPSIHPLIFCYVNFISLSLTTRCVGNGNWRAYLIKRIFSFFGALRDDFQLIQTIAKWWWYIRFNTLLLDDNHTLECVHASPADVVSLYRFFFPLFLKKFFIKLNQVNFFFFLLFSSVFMRWSIPNQIVVLFYFRWSILNHALHYSSPCQENKRKKGDIFVLE